MVNEEEDARLLDRCEAKRKEWAKHWQCARSTEALEGLEELRKCGGSTAKAERVSRLEEVSSLFEAKKGVGCDGFHPKVPVDLTTETRGEVVEFLEKVEQSGKVAATSVHDDVSS